MDGGAGGAELTNKMGLYPIMTEPFTGFVRPARSRYCLYWLAGVKLVVVAEFQTARA